MCAREGEREGKRERGREGGRGEGEGEREGWRERQREREGALLLGAKSREMALKPLKISRAFQSIIS